jgi:hypothetical protein
VHRKGIVLLARTGMRLFLLLALLPLFAACSNTATVHQTYSYTSFSRPTPDTDTWHPSDHMRLRWQARPDSTTIDDRPAQIIIRAQIIGPFVSVKAINNSITTDGVSVEGPLAAEIKPIYTDNWTNQTYTETLNLPSTLKMGYYVLVQSVHVAKSDGTVKGSTHMTIKVVPR